MGLALAHTNRPMRIKPAREQFAREWFWRLSLGFTGPESAACGWKTTFGLRTPGIKSFARIRMIFGWRVPPVRRDKYLTTPARNLNPASALDPKLVEKILAPVRQEEIISMACYLI